MHVLPDQAFNWVAFTWSPNGLPRPRRIDLALDLWATGNLAGVSAPAEVEIDLAAQSLQPSRVSGTFPLFASPWSSLGK
jgi:hypothetical protein